MRQCSLFPMLPPIHWSPAFVNAWLALLIILSVFLRVHGAGEYYYNADDMQHIEIAKGRHHSKRCCSIRSMKTHPPLGHILRHYWLMLGDTPWFVRSFSLLFGITLIPLYYQIGKNNKRQGHRLMLRHSHRVQFRVHYPVVRRAQLQRVSSAAVACLLFLSALAPKWPRNSAVPVWPMRRPCLPHSFFRYLRHRCDCPI